MPTDRTVSGSRAEAITPGDSGSGAANGEVAPASRAVYVGGAGDLEVRMEGDGAIVVFTAVPAGSCLPIRVTRVLSSNTTATSITVIY